jgi:hypothetical protein
MYQHWASTLVGMLELTILVIVSKNKIETRSNFWNWLKIKTKFFWGKMHLDQDFWFHLHVDVKGEKVPRLVSAIGILMIN